MTGSYLNSRRVRNGATDHEGNEDGKTAARWPEPRISELQSKARSHHFVIPSRSEPRSTRRERARNLQFGDSIKRQSPRSGRDAKGWGDGFRIQRVFWRKPQKITPASDTTRSFAASRPRNSLLACSQDVFRPARDRPANASHRQRVRLRTSRRLYMRSAF